MSSIMTGKLHGQRRTDEKSREEMGDHLVGQVGLPCCEAAGELLLLVPSLATEKSLPFTASGPSAPSVSDFNMKSTWQGKDPSFRMVHRAESSAQAPVS